MIRRLIASNVALQVRARTGGVRIKYIFGTSLKHNEVSHAIYRDFLPAALADGRYRAVPKPRVIGDGLEHLQAALDIQREGVSAEKVVVTIPRRRVADADDALGPVAPVNPSAEYLIVATRFTLVHRHDLVRVVAATAGG